MSWKSQAKLHRPSNVKTLITKLHLKHSALCFMKSTTPIWKNFKTDNKKNNFQKAFARIKQ